MRLKGKAAFMGSPSPTLTLKRPDANRASLIGFYASLDTLLEGISSAEISYTPPTRETLQDMLFLISAISSNAEIGWHHYSDFERLSVLWHLSDAYITSEYHSDHVLGEQLFYLAVSVARLSYICGNAELLQQQENADLLPLVVVPRGRIMRIRDIERISPRLNSYEVNWLKQRASRLAVVPDPDKVSIDERLLATQVLFPQYVVVTGGD